jgi:transcriptional regulator with XRE-family HTH domain
MSSWYWHNANDSIYYLPIEKEWQPCEIGKMSKTPRPPSFTEIQAEIGARVRQVRELYGLGQAELAAALEVDPSTLNKIEKGSRPPSVFNIISLANRLRVSTDFLLRGQLVGQMDQEVALQLAALNPDWVPPIGKDSRKGRGRA